MAAWNFDDGKLPADFKVFDGEWKVENGRLRAVGGRKDDNRVIKIAHCQWPAFRLEFDATLTANPGADPARICDIGIRFNADWLRKRCEEHHELGFVIMRHLLSVVANRLAETRFDLESPTVEVTA